MDYIELSSLEHAHTLTIEYPIASQLGASTQEKTKT